MELPYLIYRKLQNALNKEYTWSKFVIMGLLWRIPKGAGFPLYLFVFVQCQHRPVRSFLRSLCPAGSHKMPKNQKGCRYYPLRNVGAWLMPDSTNSARGFFKFKPTRELKK